MSKPSSPSRRDFLKRSSLALAGGAAALSPSIAHSARAGGSDLLRVAQIGCGNRGNGAVVDCLRHNDGVKLVAVADAFEQNARKGLERAKKNNAIRDKVDVPEDRIFWGFDAYRKAIDAGVDMVILATPPGFRPEHYRAAVAAGKHIFMEKPCCVDAPGYRQLLESNKLADEKGLKVGVGLQRRHEAPYIETVKRIKDGAIGPIQFYRVYWDSAGVWHHSREALAKRWKRELTEMEYQMVNWYYFVWLCGDHICEQHIHNMDVANWIQDAHPVEAAGTGGREVRKGPDVGHIFDHHSIEFTYADGTKMFSQCRHIPGCDNPVKEYAHGALGHADCSGRIAAASKWRFRGKYRRSYDQEHLDLIAAIRNGTPYNEGHYGATSSMTAVLGRMASYSGKTVKWDEAVANGPDEMPKKLAWDADPPVLPRDGSYEHAVPVPGLYKPY
ncbi:MAG: Gfo/Idh/MocA family oxidoreductase [Pirellulales bacterium]|nr:Gfo/Idh/MocA family oxidoreductase [Pirellulales bacterium]